MADLNELASRPIYYKTHYPFLPSVGPVVEYLNSNPDRVVVLIRNPFDAGFSEWIRYVLTQRCVQIKGDSNV